MSKLNNNLLARNTATTEIDPILKSAQSDSLYRNYSGQNRINQGEIKEASFANDFFNQSILGFDTGSVTNGYSNSVKGFDPFSSNTDFEKIRKDSQSTAAAVTNLAGQFVAKTAINTIGGIVGGFYGIGSAIGGAFDSDVSWDEAGARLFDNSFVRMTDKMTEGVEKGASVFTSQTDQKNSAFGMFSGLETFKNVSDAMAFTAGAILSEVLTAGIASAGIAATNASKWTEIANKAKSVYSSQNAIGRSIQSAGKTVDKFGRAIGYGEESFGVGKKLARLGRESDEVTTFLKARKGMPGADEALADLAMTSGMGTEAMAKNLALAESFKNITLGTRRVITGSLFEGSLEARQAKDSMMANLSQSIDDEMEDRGIPEAKRKAFKEERMAAGLVRANKLGLAVASINMGLLGVSNAVQFPTIFGKKAFALGTKMDRNTGQFTRNKILGEGAEGLARKVESSAMAKFANKTINIAKNPLSEFLEETLQGVTSGTAQNYHERLSRISGTTDGLDSSTAIWSEDFMKAFKHQYTSTEGISEGMIGAIVGALGLPIMHKNKNGKWRPTMEGGIWSELGGPSSQIKAEREAVIAAMNPENLLGALNYNTEQTKLNNAIAREENKAGESFDADRVEELKDDKIFSHVANYYDKGLSSYLAEEMEALEAMPLEEYSKRTRGEEAEIISESEKKEELKSLFDKMNSYSEAYKKVHKSMDMDKMNSNTFTERLFKHLTYSLATEKITLEKFDGLAKELKAKGSKMSDSDMYDLAVLHKAFGNMTDEDYAREMKSISEDDKRGVFQKYSEDKGSSKSDIKNAGRLHKKSAQAILSSIENDSDFDSVKAKLDAIDKMPETSRKNGKKFLQNSSIYKKAKESLSEENVLKKTQERVSQERTENESWIIDVSDKYQQQQSEVMNALVGKAKRLNSKDLKRYKELKDRHQEDMSQIERAPKSFLDAIEEESNGGAKELLNSMAKIAYRREESLRAAAALYGLDNVGQAIERIATAEFIAGIHNVEYYRKVLISLVNSEEDTEDIGKVMAYNKLKHASSDLKKKMDEFTLISEVEEGSDDPMAEIKEEILKLLEDVSKIESNFKTILDSKDALDNAITNRVADIVDSTDIVNKKEQMEADREDLEMKKEHIIINENEVFESDSKVAIAVSVTDNFMTNNDSGLSFKDMVLNGDIKKESITQMLPDFNAGSDPGFEAYLGPEMFALYQEGKKQFESNKALILNTSAMAPAFDENGHFITNGEYSALQLFVAAYRVNMNFTNGTHSMDYELGKKITLEGDAVVSSSYLFTPFFILNKERAANEKFENEQRAAAYQAKIDRIENSKGTRVKKDKAILALSREKAENDMKSSKANDIAIYNLRKRMLIEMHANDIAGESNENYSLLMKNTLNYGNIQVTGEDAIGFKNYLISGNEGEFQGMDLIDAESNTDGTPKDPIDVLIEKNQLKYVNQEGNFVSMVDNSITLDHSKNQKATGRIYFIHETPSGQTMPVELNRQTLSSNEVIMNDLMKYVKMGLENAGDQSNDIQDIPIEIQQGEFMGVFDNNPNKPTQLKRLLEMFAATKSNAGADVSKSYLISFKEKELLNIEEEVTSETTIPSELDDLKDVLQEFVPGESVAEAKKPKVKMEYSILIGNLTLSKEDSIDVKMEQIRKSLGGLRYYMNSSLFKIYEKGEATKFNKEAFKIMVKSGLITHGFNVKENFDKIYEKTNTQGEEQVIKIVMNPINNAVVRRAVLNKNNEKRREAKIAKTTASDMLKNVFWLDAAKMAKFKLSNFNEATMRNQFLWKIDKAFTDKKIVGSNSPTKKATKSDEARWLIEAVEESFDLIKEGLEKLSVNKPNTYSEALEIAFERLMERAPQKGAKKEAITSFEKELKDIIKRTKADGKMVNLAKMIVQLAKNEIDNNEELQGLLIKHSDEHNERFNFHDLLYGNAVTRRQINLAGTITRGENENPTAKAEVTKEFLEKAEYAVEFFRTIGNHSFSHGKGYLVPEMKISFLNNSNAKMFDQVVGLANLDRNTNNAEFSSTRYKGLLVSEPFTFKYLATKADAEGKMVTKMYKAKNLEEAISNSDPSENGSYDGIMMVANMMLKTVKTNDNGYKKSIDEVPVFWGSEAAKHLVYATKGTNKKERFTYIEKIYLPGFDSDLTPIAEDYALISNHMVNTKNTMNKMTTEIGKISGKKMNTDPFANSDDVLAEYEKMYEEVMKVQAEQMKLDDLQEKKEKSKKDAPMSKEEMQAIIDMDEDDDDDPFGNLFNSEVVVVDKSKKDQKSPALAVKKIANENDDLSGLNLDFKPRSLAQQKADKEAEELEKSKKETPKKESVMDTLSSEVNGALVGASKESIKLIGEVVEMEESFEPGGIVPDVAQFLKKNYGTSAETILPVAIRDVRSKAVGTLSEKQAEIIYKKLALSTIGRELSAEEFDSIVKGC